ncbi:MAG: tail fiber domain-containing protein [Bdellovibrionales bacterium]|nr:tail fiber domain-containing protein [Bdellovibrionales bacterium]
MGPIWVARRAIAAVSPNFVYQGIFLNAAGTWPLTSVVDLQVGIYDPSGNCMLYEEEYVGLDLSASNGTFSIRLGSGTQTANSVARGYNMVQVFSNSQTTPAASVQCLPGYTPAASDGRTLHVEIKDPTVTGVYVALTPNQSIESVPTAVIAQTLQGYVPSDFVTSGGTNNVTSANLASNSVDSSKIQDGTVALADLAGNSVDSSKIVDASITNADIANSTINPTTKLDAAICANGEILQKVAGVWACAVPNVGGTVSISTSGTINSGAITSTGAITGTSLSASGGGTISTTGATNTGTLTATGAINGASVTTTGAISAGTTLTVGTGLTVTSGGANIIGNSTITGNTTITGTLGSGAITSTGAITGTSLTASGGGTISTTGAMNSGTVTTTGAISSGTTLSAATTITAGTGLTVASGNATLGGAGSILDFTGNGGAIRFKDNDTNTVTITAPADITPANYTLTLPVAPPAAGGYALVSTTGGVLSWAAMSGGTVGGSGTVNTVPKFSAASTLSDSTITDTGALVTIGSAASVTGALTVTGALNANGSIASTAQLNVNSTNGTPQVNLQAGGTTRVQAHGTGASVTGTLAVSGNTTLTGDVAVNGGDITSTAATLNLNPTTTLNLQTGGTTRLAASAAGAAVTGALSATTSLTSGTNGGTGGTLVLNGSTSGALTLDVPASITSYSFTWPSAAPVSPTTMYLRGDGSWTAPPTGITNGAGANVITKSDGTNLVASGLTDDGTNLTIARNTSVSGTNTFTVGTGAATFGGTLNANGSIASTAQLNINSTNGTPQVNLQAGGTTRVQAHGTGASVTGTLAVSGASTFTGAVNANGSIASTAQLNINSTNGTPQVNLQAGGTTRVQAHGTGASVTGDLTVSNNTTALAYFHSSDARLKENVVTYENALDTVAALRGVRFDWKKSGISEIGFIAQEVEAVDPVLVTTGNDAMKTKAVKYANITAILVEAVKELKDQNAELRKKVSDLEARLNEKDRRPAGQE